MTQNSILILELEKEITSLKERKNLLHYKMDDARESMKRLKKEEELIDAQIAVIEKYIPSQNVNNLKTGEGSSMENINEQIIRIATEFIEQQKDFERVRGIGTELRKRYKYTLEDTNKIDIARILLKSGKFVRGSDRIWRFKRSNSSEAFSSEGF
jgi:hypothetical protein